MSKFDCEHCDKQKKKMWGCDLEVPAPVFELNKITFYRCPIKIIQEDTEYQKINNYINAYNWHDKGIMPEPGALSDQSFFYYEIVSFIAQEINKGIN